MRLNYYEFPEGTPEEVLLENGCAVILKSGEEIFPETIPDDKRDLVKYIEHVIGGVTVTWAKKMLKEYGGVAWTDHIDRDGGVFEVTPIRIAGNNSRFKYNHHL